MEKTGVPGLPESRRRYDWSDGLYFRGFLPGSTATTYIDVAPDRIEVKAAAITLTGDVHIAGSLTTTGDTTSNGKSLDSHTHGGILNGSGTSGRPN